MHTQRDNSPWKITVFPCKYHQKNLVFHTYPHLYLTTHKGTSPTLPTSPPPAPAPPAAAPPPAPPSQLAPQVPKGFHFTKGKFFGASMSPKKLTKVSTSILVKARWNIFWNLLTKPPWKPGWFTQTEIEHAKKIAQIISFSKQTNKPCMHYFFGSSAGVVFFIDLYATSTCFK